MKIILLTFLIHAICFAQSEKLQEEKEMEVVNFNSIKKVLSQDGLSEAAFKKEIPIPMRSGYFFGYSG
jgi:hypothetical protein